MSKKQYIIHILTGDGKGKTTAGLGLALRALGAGKKVAMIQFMKKPQFSEHKAIKKYKLPIDIEAYGIGFYKILGDKHTEEDHKKAVQKAWERAKEVILTGKHDLVILDEINVAIGFKLLDINKVIQFLESVKAERGKLKPDSRYCDLILTGRQARPKLKKIAHLVSEIKEIKHYFNSGLQARKGIEY